jgi:hypothetical protein
MRMISSAGLLVVAGTLSLVVPAAHVPKHGVSAGEFFTKAMNAGYIIHWVPTIRARSGVSGPSAFVHTFISRVKSLAGAKMFTSTNHRN